MKQYGENKIVITTNGAETLARLYSGDKVTKTASTKCSSTDTFSFAMGAKIAFERLMQDKPVEPIKPAVDYSAWRVVKRAPVVGDKVRVVKAYMTGGEYKNGDILTVALSRLVSSPDNVMPSVRVKEFDTPCVMRRELEVIESSPAFKVGDRVRINANNFDTKFAGLVGTVSTIDAGGYCRINGEGINPIWCIDPDRLSHCPERMVRVFSKSAYNAFIDAIDQHEVVDAHVGGIECHIDWTNLVPESEVRK